MAAPDLASLLAHRLALLGPKVQTEPGQRDSSAIARFVAGFTNGGQLRHELDVLGYSGVRLERLAFSAVLDRQLAMVQERTAALIAAFRAGTLDPGQIKARMVQLGVAEDVADARAATIEATPPRRAKPKATVGLQLVAEPGTIELPRRKPKATVGLTVAPETGTIELPRRRPKATVGLRLVLESGAPPAPRQKHKVTVGLTITGQVAPPREVARKRKVIVGLRITGQVAPPREPRRKQKVTVGLRVAPIR